LKYDYQSFRTLCLHSQRWPFTNGCWLPKHLAGDRIEVRSAGTDPGDKVNPAAVEAMAEEGIDISVNFPKKLTDEAVKESDYVITMGCGDTCPFFPGKTYLDWPLDDPAGQGVDAVRPIRDAVRAKVEALIAEIDSK
jgi:protein-tyrosine-phosphatase